MPPRSQKKTTPKKAPKVSFTPPADPMSVAPEVVKDQMVPCTCMGKPANYDPQCPLHRSAPATIHNPSMMDVVARAHQDHASLPGRFVVRLGNEYWHRAVGFRPGLNGAYIYPNYDLANKLSREHNGTVMRLQEAMDREFTPVTVGGPARPQCRFQKGDQVIYRKNLSLGVGVVELTDWSERAKAWFVEAKIGDDTFRVFEHDWDFALPSEANPDFVKATPSSPQNVGPQRLFTWSKEKKAGMIAISEGGTTTFYCLRKTADHIVSFCKLTAGEYGAEVHLPYYVRISKNRDATDTNCTCDGFIRNKVCRHANAIYHAVISNRI